MFRNHTQQRSIVSDDRRLRKLFRPQLWPALPLAWSVFIVSLFTDYAAPGALLAVAAIVAYLVWRSRVTRRRTNTYLAATSEPLIKRLDEHANELLGPFQRATST